MDFWAQHKDFILKVLAGVIIFLVALIARGVTYGDDLDRETARNRKLAGDVKRLKLAPVPQIQALGAGRDRLQANAAAILDQIGWNAADEPALQLELLRRTLGYLRAFKDLDRTSFDRAVDQMRQAIRDDLNGGFGQLRLRVRDELVEEAGERNIPIAPGLGFENVLGMDASVLTKYMLQLELAARLVRLCIDERVDAVTEIRLREHPQGEAIPEANPEFLREYFVDIEVRGSQPALARVLNRLDEGKRVPWRDLQLERLQRPADHISAALTVVALAANPEVPFAMKEEKP